MLIRVLSDWPEAFQERLIAFRRPPSEGKRLQRVNEAWPSLFRFVDRLDQASDRELVWSAVESLVRKLELTDQPLFGRNKFVRTGSVSLTQTAKQLGLTNLRLRQAIQQVLPDLAVRNETRSGRVWVRLTSRQAEALRAHVDDQISHKAAGRILGLSIDRVRQLVAVGLLSIKDAKLSRANCQSLGARILAMASRARLTESVLSLNELLRTRVPSQFLAPFIDAIFTGRLRVYAMKESEQVAGRVQLRTSEVVKWIESHRTAQDTLSVNDTAVRLGIKPQAFDQWVSRGFVRTEIGPSGRGRARVVTREARSDFVSRYFPLARVTRAAGIAKQLAYGWAVEHGLKLVSGPLVDGSRQYLVERVDNCPVPNWPEPAECVPVAGRVSSGSDGD